MAVVFGARRHADLRASSYAQARRVRALGLAAAPLAAAVLATALGAWAWRVAVTRCAEQCGRSPASGCGSPWPAWPLALWTLWRWRRQLMNRHVCRCRWPRCCVGRWPQSAMGGSDRALMLGAARHLAVLAAFALPTLRAQRIGRRSTGSRSSSSPSCAIAIWVIYVAMQTGMPAQPAANVARLAPGFEPSSRCVALLLAHGRHGGLAVARALAHRAPARRDLEEPGAARRRRRAVLAAADDPVAAAAGLRAQLPPAGRTARTPRAGEAACVAAPGLRHGARGGARSASAGSASTHARRAGAGRAATTLLRGRHRGARGTAAPAGLARWSRASAGRPTAASSWSVYRRADGR